MILIISEKKDFSRKIADCFGEEYEEKEGYFSIEDIHITWTWGHLISLEEPKAYDEKYKNWNIFDLPIFPKEYKYRQTGKKEQFLVIEQLLKTYPYKEVICATDAEREGELIFRLLSNYLNIPEPISRMWCDTTTSAGIKKAFDERKDIHCYDGYYHEANAREKSDWLIGMNLTRLYTGKFYYKFPIGRVQTPTMCLIYDREKEIENFISEDIFTLVGSYENFSFSKQYDTEKDAEKDLNKKTLMIEKIEETQKTIKSPKLFKLSTLQQRANEKYGYTLSTTLNIVQSLYQKGLVSYPRTNSEFLPEDMKEEYLNILNSLAKEYLVEMDDLDPDKVFDNTKIDAHYALIVVSNDEDVLKYLSPDETNIFQMIYRQMLIASMKNFIYVEVKIFLEDGFQGTMKQEVESGFNAVYQKYHYEQPNQFFEGDELPVELELKKSKTKPKKHYTDATIVRKMENLNDESSGYSAGIGTPATRDGIIERLIEHEYIYRDKKNLRTTPKADLLYRLISNQLKNIELTSAIEEHLTKIRTGDLTEEQFLKTIYVFIEKELERVNKMEDIKTKICKCPFCGKDVYRIANKYECEDEDCSFSIWKNNRFLIDHLHIPQDKINDDFIRKLCSEKGIYVKGLQSKKGTTYDAVITPVKNGEYTNFSINYDVRKKKRSEEV